ncbi:hypothetical protein [Paucibacter soli]|uniref:hypothetical protein n=1 Tax=Paucibacter soli TaxID=3133433 RepID=UPI0030B4BA38
MTATSNTVYCYDRYDRVKRLALVLGVVSGLASGVLMMGSVQANVGSHVETLPRVVINGARQAEPSVAQLPRVVVEGKRQPAADAQRLALASQP